MILCNGKCRKGAVDLDCRFHLMRCGKGVVVTDWYPYPFSKDNPCTKLAPCRKYIGHDGDCISS